jgi:hypothetical protein
VARAASEAGAAALLDQLSVGFDGVLHAIVSVARASSSGRDRGSA